MIYKYEIMHGRTLNVRQGKIVLSGRQGSEFFVWVLLDSLAQFRAVRIFATGEEIPIGWNWAQSFQDGAYVWHVFERDL